MNRPFNQIVGNEYDDLVKAMINCGANDNLPQCLELRKTSGISLNDVHDLIKWFTVDTGLQMKFQAEICSDCGKLHAFLFIDYPEENEKIPFQ